MQIFDICFVYIAENIGTDELYKKFILRIHFKQIRFKIIIIFSLITCFANMCVCIRVPDIDVYNLKIRLRNLSNPEYFRNYIS